MSVLLIIYLISGKQLEAGEGTEEYMCGSDLRRQCHEKNLSFDDMYG